MNAIIFAAGLGTRLAPITNNKPKALVEVAGKPMLLHAIDNLVSAGVERIVINVHHFADKVIEYINSITYANVDILISNEKDELLDTGGGLLKAAPLFLPNKPIVLYNADILTGVNLKAMLSFHANHNGVATLMVKKRETSRYFLFDEEMRLSGWENKATGEKLITRKTNDYNAYAFSGIHIVSPEILTMLGDIHKFSITKGYLNISKENNIYGWKDWDDYWFDIGTPQKLKIAEEYIESLNR